MTRSWFTRVWTLQEILLARNATVVCGDDHCVAWATAIKCLFLFSILLTALRDPYSGSHAQRRLRRLSTAEFGALETLVNVDSLPVEILKIYLQNPGLRRARDPKDYVFGLAGLFEPDVKLKLKVDYTLSISKVFSNATRVVSQHSSGAGEWCRLMEAFVFRSQDSRYQLPSWCPDFSRFSTTDELGYIGYWARVAEGTRHHFELDFPATFNDEGSLMVPAILLDKIAYITETAPPDGDYSELEKVFDETSRNWFAAMASMFSASGISLVYQPQEWIHAWLFARLPWTEDTKAPLFEEPASESPRHIGARLVVETKKCADALLQGNRGKHFFTSQEGRIGYSSRSTNPAIAYVISQVESTFMSSLLLAISMWPLHASTDLWKTIS